MPYGMDDTWGQRRTGDASENRNFISPLWVPTGGFVSIRILSEHNQIYKNWTHHNLAVVSGDREYWTDRVCKGTDKCEYCLSGHKATKMFFAWAYVYNRYWPLSTPEEKRKNNVVEKGKANGREWLIETINGVKLWKRTFGKDDQYWLDLKNFKERFNDTLTDRDYEIHRLGEETKPTYNMMYLDPKPMSEELLVLLSSLPDLEKVALGEIITMDGESPQAKVVDLSPNVRSVAYTSGDNDGEDDDPDNIDDLLPF